MADSAPEPGTVVVEEAGTGTYANIVRAGRHVLAADEPVKVGGTDTGPGPYEYLLAALGACTSMTIRMYAARKGIALERVEVRLRHDRIHAKDCADCETKEGLVDRIVREIHLHGALDEATRTRLREIADKCPVHRTLTSEIRSETRLA